MSDEEIRLPSSSTPSPPANDEVRLPRGQHQAGEPDVVTSARQAKPAATLAERMTQSTMAGGLTDVPIGFDDPDGDWQTIGADSPFARLYLDHRQQVTPEMVCANAAILTGFWAAKVNAMNQGAARAQITRKFAGGDERKLLGYEGDIQAAAALIASADAIAQATAGLEAARTRAGRVAMARSLEIAMLDGRVVPEETARLMQDAMTGGLTDIEATASIIEELRAAGFHPRVDGRVVDPLPAQPFSVTWTTAAVTPLAQKDAQPDPVRVEKAVTPNKTQAPWSPSRVFVTLVSAIVVVFAGVALVWFLRQRIPPPSSSGRVGSAEGQGAIPAATLSIPGAETAAGARGEQAASPASLAPKRPTPVLHSPVAAQTTTAARPSPPALTPVESLLRGSEPASTAAAIEPPRTDTTKTDPPKTEVPKPEPSTVEPPKPEPPPQESRDGLLYGGPMTGEWKYDGPGVVQNQELVVPNLPKGRLILTLDENAWAYRLEPAGETQRLVLVSKKRGVQKKCTVKWRLDPGGPR